MSTNWETTDILKAPMEICWQFDYEIHIDKLHNLYKKSKRMMWDSDVDIDWTREIVPSKPLVGELGLGLELACILAKPTAVSPGNYSSFQDQGRSLGMEAGEHLFFYPLAVQEQAALGGNRG